MISYNHWKKKSPEAVKLLRQVKKEIYTIVPDAEVILYGSQARGNPGQYSDWDFLIIIDQPLDKELIVKIRDRLYDLELETDTVLSAIIRTHNDWYSAKYNVLPLKKEVDQEGVLL